MPVDTRIVYGAVCTWWDSIQKVGRTPPTPNGHSLPACPHCKGVLFEMRDEAAWWRGVDAYEATGHPGYRAMTEWARGKCFRTSSLLGAAYSTYKAGLEKQTIPSPGGAGDDKAIGQMTREPKK